MEWIAGAMMGIDGRGYLQAAVNTKVIWSQICSVIKAIGHVHPKMKFHLIGFSLGGQASGFAGKECRNAEDGSPIIEKISGKSVLAKHIIHNIIAWCAS